MNVAREQKGTNEVVPQVGRRGALGFAVRTGGITLAASLGACTFVPDWDHDGPDAPAVAPPPPGAAAPRVAWVFGSGGPRGFVHVGVLKALAELGLRPDLVVGSSVGALIGVLCAAGLPAAEIERLALNLSPTSLARVNFAGAAERLSGGAIADFVRERVPQPLERLDVPVACVVQRLADGAVLGFNRGDAGLAVQASAAIPGSFSPVRIRGQRYADADGVMPLPVRLARALGALRVLAVDASAHENRAPPGAERYREGDLRKRALTRPDAERADLVLQPDFGYWVSLSREFRVRAIAAGHREGLRAAAALAALHAA